MHESMTRLFLAAKQLKGKTTPTELADLLNESQQNINNWKKRGVSKEGAVKAQQIIGCDCYWLFTGEGDMKPWNATKQINGFSDAIKEERELDAYSLIEQALRRLIIVGGDKDRIIDLIKDRANQALEVQKLFGDVVNGATSKTKT